MRRIRRPGFRWAVLNDAGEEDNEQLKKFLIKLLIFIVSFFVIITIIAGIILAVSNTKKKSNKSSTSSETETAADYSTNNTTVPNCSILFKLDPVGTITDRGHGFVFFNTTADRTQYSYEKRQYDIKFYALLTLYDENMNPICQKCTDLWTYDVISGWKGHSIMFIESEMPDFKYYDWKAVFSKPENLE